MAHTYEDLRAKTIGELRELAKDLHHPSLQGYTQMNKEHLLPAICKVLKIETHEHHDVVGIDKTAIKAKMRALKQQRDEALEAHDGDRLKSIRRQLHSLNRQIRAHVSP